MKQNQYLIPAAIVALALVILIVAFKPNNETTTLATPSARGGVTAPEMLPLLAKVTELTEKTVQSQNEARSAQNEVQLAKNQAAQLASEVRAANQALEIAQQEVARLAKIIQDANDRSIKVGMHIDEAVRRIGSPSHIINLKEWELKKWSPGNYNRDGAFDDSNKYPSLYVYKYPRRLIFSDMKSARRQDPNMNKNDDQAWLIKRLWIFIDENKIITSTGPSEYDFK